MVMLRVKADTMRFWVKNPKKMAFWKMVAASSAANTRRGSTPVVRILRVVQ